MTDTKNEHEEEQEINLLEIVHVVVRRKWLVVRLCSAAAAISVIASLFLPNVYTATAKVLPPQKDGGGGLAALLSQAGGLAGLTGMASGMAGGGTTELYLGILKSRSVADAVIRRPDLAKVFSSKTPDQARRALEGAVKFKAGKDGIISINADHNDPKIAALLANTFVDELGRKSVQLNLTKAGTERAFLEKRLDIVKNDLRRAEEALKSFQEANKTVRVDSQTAASIQAIAKLKAELISKEVQLASLMSYQTEESADVKGLRTVITKIRSQLGSLVGSGDSGDAIPTIGSAPNLGLEYFRKMRELKTQEAIYEQLTKQNEVAKLSEAKDSSAIQVLDEAVVPTVKSKPHRALIVILSTLAAFVVGVLVIFMQEYFGKMPEHDKALWQEIKGTMFTVKGRG